MTLNVRPILFIALLFYFFYSINGASAANCPSDRFDQQSKVTQVFDGDTVQLSDGKKVRLIGVNSPEMNYKTRKPEPYARQARQFLKEKVLHKTVKLRFGNDRQDRYKRYLAHLFLEDGTNLQAELIQNGLATNIAIPPNLWQQTCYQKLERNARQHKIGMWSDLRFQPLDANKVSQQTLGFYWVKGTIKSVKHSKKSIWFNLTDNMALRISKKDSQLFNNLSDNYWQGKTIIAKGWIGYRNKNFSMGIRHPSAIEH